MTAPQEDWGPWVQHDGKGCPCVGQYVELELTTDGLGVTASGKTDWTIIGIVQAGNLLAWDWSKFNTMKPNGMLTPKVIRYRIRRPKGMAILNAVLADFLAPVKTDGVIA